MDSSGVFKGGLDGSAAALGSPCLRSSSQAITPTELALAQCPAASRQSLSLAAHKSELLTSGSVASPFSRGVSACVWHQLPSFGVNAEVAHGVLLSLPPSSAPGASLAAQSPPGDHGVSLPAWLAACPPASRAADMSFLSNSNEIFPLLGALPGLGSAFSRTQLSPVLRPR